MKTYGLLLSLFLLTLPLNVSAGWQVSKPQTAVPQDAFYQAATQDTTSSNRASNDVSNFTSYANTAMPDQFANAGAPASVYAISISGSLKENIERIMGRYHWRVVWKAPYDYNFDGRVTGSSLPNVVEKLLKPFPLKAVMYMSNRTLAIVPRSRT